MAILLLVAFMDTRFVVFLALKKTDEIGPREDQRGALQRAQRAPISFFAVQPAGNDVLLECAVQKRAHAVGRGSAAVRVVVFAIVLETTRVRSFLQNSNPTAAAAAAARLRVRPHLRQRRRGVGLAGLAGVVEQAVRDPYVLARQVPRGPPAYAGRAAQVEAPVERAVVRRQKQLRELGAQGRDFVFGFGFGFVGFARARAERQRRVLVQPRVRARELAKRDASRDGAEELDRRRGVEVLRVRAERVPAQTGVPA